MNTKPCEHYTAEFKAQAIELIGTGKPVSQIAEELCLSSNLRSLRRENAFLKQERRHFKKAAIILGARSQPNSGK